MYLTGRSVCDLVSELFFRKRRRRKKVLTWFMYLVLVSLDCWLRSGFWASSMRMFVGWKCFSPGFGAVWWSAAGSGCGWTVDSAGSPSGSPWCHCGSTPPSGPVWPAAAPELPVPADAPLRTLRTNTGRVHATEISTHDNTCSSSRGFTCWDIFKHRRPSLPVCRSGSI